MTLENLKEFLSDCIESKIKFPREPIKIVISDFHKAVPEEHRNAKNLEFNHRVGQEFARVIILPEPN